MIRKFTLSLALATALVASADNRSEAQMQSIAAEKLQSIGAMSSHAKGSMHQYVAEALDMPQMKIYKSDEGGFVIVSKDDRIRPVLAYSSAVINADDMPCCMKWWIDATAKSISMALEAGENLADDNRPSFVPVEPFMMCHWNQNAPYNNLAPVIGKKHAPSGCVATAMAQVIWHNRFPASAEFIGSFTEPGNNVVKKEPVHSTYNYDLMAEGYGSYTAFGEKTQRSYTDEEGNAVAQLMHDCALASKMDFNTDGSGAYSSDYGHSLHNFFGYPKNSIKSLLRACFTDDEWHQMVYDELQKHCPIMYSGAGSDGGHCFVVHGIDDKGMVYVNWGWGGNYDGYFDMDLMNSQGTSMYNLQQNIVIGIRPTALPEDKVTSLFASFDGFDAQKLLRSFTISSMVYNFGAYDFNGKLGFHFVDEADGSDQYVDVAWNNGAESESITPWYGTNLGVTINPSTATNVSLLPGHSYIVYPVSQCQEEVEEGRFSYIREQIVEHKSGDRIWFRLTIDASKKVGSLEKFIGEIPLPTSIHDAVLPQNAVSSAARYNISGQRVADNYRGIVIVNGKKNVQ